jgi:hypothetical protein
MRNNHPILTYAYHFLSEAIILFLFVLPFLHHRFMWEPYGSYIITAIAACIIFSVITKFSVHYVWYMLTAPILFIAFYFMDYPIVLSILFAGVFVWRYIDILHEEAVSRENNYIIITLVLTAINSIIVQDTRILVYPFILFAIILFGYIISHLAVVNKSERKQFNTRLPVYFIGMLAAGAGLLLLLFDVIRLIIVTAFQGVLDFIGNVIASIAHLFSFFEPQEMEPVELEEGEAGENPMAEYWNELEGTSVMETIAPYAIIIISLVFLTILVFVIVWFWKNRHYKRLNEVKQNESVLYTNAELDRSPSLASFSQWRKRIFNKPAHPVRKMVYQFERTAAKHQMGRRRSETIEAWLKRIGAEVDFHVYQKVRYADAEVGENEANELKEQIRKTENRLEQKNKIVNDGS